MDSFSAVSKLGKHAAHVYHIEWLGIKSAVTALDGLKVPISYENGISQTQLSAIVEKIQKANVRRVVFHGFSGTAKRLLLILSRLGLDCYLVWHGNFAQLAWEPEVLYFADALEAARKGYFKRCHVMKASQSEIFPAAYNPMLPNVVPKNPYKRVSPPFSQNKTTAFIAATKDIRKNAYTNFYAATSSPQVDRVLHYMNVEKSIIDNAKLKRVRFKGPKLHLALQCEIDICINATVVDCLPMVDLEALSAGVPSITGPLFRDFLTDHPYVHLCEVVNPFDVSLIRDRIAYIAQIPTTELAEILQDFTKSLVRVSHERYEEFLNL